MDNQNPNQNAGDAQRQSGDKQQGDKPEQGAGADKNWNQPGSKNPSQGGGQRPSGQPGGGQQGGQQGGTQGGNR